MTATPDECMDPYGESPPAYYECPSCGFLSPDPGFASGETPCPLCGAAGGARRSFPTERLRRLDERIRAYHDDRDSEIVVILAATFLETMLEDVIDRILVARGADVTVRAAVLDGHRAIGARIGKLFPQLTGEEFEHAATELGYGSFPHRWRELRQARNAFIHDSPFASPQETLSHETACEAMELLGQAYELFVLISNRFVARDRSAGS